LKRYEIPFIVHTDLTEEEINSLIDRYRTIITDLKGIIVKIEKWGKRKLAYEIKKQTNGFYILLDFVGQSNIIAEMERNFKIDDKILKYMTVKKEDRVDLEKIEKERQEEIQVSTPPADAAPDSPLIISSHKTAAIDPHSIPSEVKEN
jgi:small subunit ribosomal protein S6